MKKPIKTKLELECQLLSTAMNLCMKTFLINGNPYASYEDIAPYWSAHYKLKEFEDSLNIECGLLSSIILQKIGKGFFFFEYAWYEEPTR